MRNSITTQSPTAKLFTSIIESQRGRYTHDEIAAAAGFATSNAIPQIKAGRTRLPIRRIVPICSFLGIDPKELLSQAIVEYHPECVEAFRLFNDTTLSDDEAKLLAIYWRARERFLKGAKQQARSTYTGEAMAKGDIVTQRALRDVTALDAALTSDATKLHMVSSSIAAALTLR